MAPNQPPTLRAFDGITASGPDGEIDLGGPKQRAVLATLLVAPRSVVPLDRIIDTLWGDDPPSRAEVSIRGYVSNLRKALSVVNRPAVTIEFRDRGYMLDVPPDAVDVHRFEEAVHDGLAAARLGEMTGTRARLQSALELWTGPPFGSSVDPMSVIEVVQRLEQRRGDAVETLADVRLALGEHAEVASDLPAEISALPYREHLRAQFALALYRAGRPVDALRSIEDARRALAEDVGVDPGPELRDLEARILAHDASLAWAPPRETPARESHAATPRHRVEPPLLFGRRSEQDALAAQLDALASGGRCVLITGEPGIGKTALARALRDAAVDAGIPVGWGRCPESAAAAPYRSWRTAIDQLAEAGATEPFDATLAATGSLTDGTDLVAARLATHIGIVDTLRRAAPCLIVIDDLQWADDATLALLEFLGPELDDLPVLLAVTVRRMGPVDLGPHVRDCLAELVRGTGSVQLHLEGLDRSSVSEWVRHTVGGRPHQQLADLLADTTDGNPFYLRELLALLDAEGRLDDDATSSIPGTVPAAVQDVVRRRTSRLPPGTQALLATAAVVGRRFDLDLLAAVVEADRSQVLDEIEPALAVGLVETDDTTPGRFAFSHALVAETLVAEQNPIGIARLHARITREIVRLHGHTLEPWLGELALHAAAGASAGTANEAVEYSIAAADIADDAQASADVAAHLERALAVIAASDLDTPRRRIELLTRRGVALRDSGDISGGRAALVDAALLAESVGADDAVATALAALCTDDIWAGVEWSLYDQRTAALVERVLGRSTDAEPAVVAQLESTLAGELVYLDPVRSRQISTDAVASAERSGDPVVLARVLLQRYWGLHSTELVRERVELGDRMISLVSESDLPDRFVPLAHLLRSNPAYELGDRETLDECFRNARATAHPVRTPVGWAHLKFLESSLALLDGDPDRAAAVADEVQEAFWRVRRFAAITTRGAIVAVARAEQGRVDEALEALAVVEDSLYEHSMKWLKAWLLVDNGRDDDARRALSSFDGPLQDDWMRIPLTVAGVLAAARLGDVGFLRRHLHELDPIADRFASLGGGGIVLGPAAYALAEGTAALGDLPGARAHLDVAHAIAERMRAALWLPRIEALGTSLG